MPPSTGLVFFPHMVLYFFFFSLKCDLFEEAAFFWSSIFNVDLLTLNDHLTKGAKAHFWHYLWIAYALQKYGRNCPGIPISSGRKIYFWSLFFKVILKSVAGMLMLHWGMCDSKWSTNWVGSGDLEGRGIGRGRGQGWMGSKLGLEVRVFKKSLFLIMTKISFVSYGVH